MRREVYEFQASLGQPGLLGGFLPQSVNKYVSKGQNTCICDETLETHVWSSQSLRGSTGYGDPWWEMALVRFLGVFFYSFLKFCLSLSVCVCM